MKRTLLFIACILTSITMLAQDGLAVGDIQNSGCLNETRGEDSQRVPTIVLTKEGSVLSVQLLNYESVCGTTDFNVTSAVSGVSDSIPYSVNISVVPIVLYEMDCICPYNVSFTVRDVEVNSFYLSCWWYEGQVTLEEGEPLVLEDITLYATINGAKYTLKKTLGTATLTEVIEQKSEIRIPSVLNYEGQTYTVKSIYRAFVNCPTIKTLDIPESVSTILSYSFFGCKLDTLIIRGFLESRYINSDLLYGLDTDMKVFVQPSEVEKYKTIYNGPVYPLSEAQDDSNYLPFVELNKQWHVAISYGSPYYGGSLSNYRMYEEVERNGKTYVHAEAGLYREENRRVYKYDEMAGRDIMLYDFSLKEGDTFTYEMGPGNPVNCKVLKQGWLYDGPNIVSSCTLVADSLETKYRRLRTWTIGRDNGSGEYDEIITWVECIGALENMFNAFATGARFRLAYVERKDHEVGYGKNEYLPFSFYSTSMHGCDLPTDKSIRKYDDRLHHLTYELEGNLLHVYGDVYTQCGPNNYAYFYEKPTDDPLVHMIVFQPTEVPPLADCIDHHATNFFVPGFNPNLSYIVADDHGEEHPVINKTPQNEYHPFVEDNKVWKVGLISSGNPVQLVEHYYFNGDTIIDGKACKQMMRQQYVTPDYAESNNISQDDSFGYVGAWYEEDKKVYLYNATNNQFMLMYDFSRNASDTLLIDNHRYAIGPKQTGGIKGFKGVYRNVRLAAEGGSIYSTPWLEGVGGTDGPTINVYPGQVDPAWVLISCTVNDEVIYHNDEYKDVASPAGARSRFDFTHTTKPKPKAPQLRGAEQTLYGEYNNVQLGINLNPLDDAYLVRITNEAGNVVYEKAINAGNIVGLNIDISTYPKGRYTVIVENSEETFTGEFEAQTTGIEEVRSQRSEVKSNIYNLQGQRLNALQKGLNIVNGQKVFVN